MSLALLKNGFSRMQGKCATMVTGMSTIAASSAASAFDFNNIVDTGDGIEGVADNATNMFEIFFNVIKGLAVLVGLIFIFMGVMRIKKSQDPNGGVSPVSGIILLIVGGLMAVLPWLLVTMASTVSG